MPARSVTVGEDSKRVIAEPVIELHVPDFQAAYDFYRQFQFALRWVDDNYMVLARGEHSLCFYGGNPEVAAHSYFGRFSPDTKRGYAVELVLFVIDVKRCFQSLWPTTKVIEPPRQRLWGATDFRVEDPFGFYVRVTEQYDVQAAPPSADVPGRMRTGRLRI